MKPNFLLYTHTPNNVFASENTCIATTYMDIFYFYFKNIYI